jgi:hypothetical protein
VAKLRAELASLRKSQSPVPGPRPPTASAASDAMDVDDTDVVWDLDAMQKVQVALEACYGPLAALVVEHRARLEEARRLRKAAKPLHVQVTVAHREVGKATRKVAESLASTALLRERSAALLVELAASQELEVLWQTRLAAANTALLELHRRAAVAPAAEAASPAAPSPGGVAPSRAWPALPPPPPSRAGDGAWAAPTLVASGVADASDDRADQQVAGPPEAAAAAVLGAADRPLSDDMLDALSRLEASASTSPGLLASLRRERAAAGVCVAVGRTAGLGSPSSDR